jgi:hypothetical protein
MIYFYRRTASFLRERARYRRGYFIIVLFLIISCLSGCSYSPQRVVKYEPQDIIREQKKDTVPPRIIITNPRTDTRGLAIVSAGNEIVIEGKVISTNLLEKITIDNENVSILKDNSFRHKRHIFKGINHIRITAVDESTNYAEKSLIIDGGTGLTPQVIVSQERPVVPKPIFDRTSKAALWILSIGISEYRNPSLNLKYADNDARVLANTMKNYEGGMFSEVFVKILVNSEATRGNILTAMTTHLGKAAPNDIVFIFLAGHGIKNNQTGSYYFVPYNADSENLLFEGLKWSDFDEAIKIISTNVNKVILVLDTCHAGAINVAMRNVNVGEDLAETMKNATGLYILSASKGGESSIESDIYKLPGEKKGHGAFTYSLLKGLKGEAKQTNKPYITVNDLFSYVSSQVPRITNGLQHPYSKMEGTDLPIVLFK